MTIEAVTTTVEVEVIVVVVEDCVDVGDEDVVTDDVEVSVVVVDEKASVVVVSVDSVDTVEDADVESAVVGVDVEVAGGDSVDTVEGVDVVDESVIEESSIGKNVTALAVAIFEITPTTAKKRIRLNATGTRTDFIQLSLLYEWPSKGNGTLPHAGSRAWSSMMPPY